MRVRVRYVDAFQRKWIGIESIWLIMEFDTHFSNEAEAHAFAEFCCQPDSSIPFVGEPEVESILCNPIGPPNEVDTAPGTVDLTQHPSGCVPVVNNMTATCSLGCKPDLAKIACHTRNTEYNPKGLPGAIMRLVDPKSVALIFDSGKMVVMGTQTKSALNLAARRIAKIIKTVGFPVRFHGFKVVNMLATCDTRFPIRIEGVHFQHAWQSYYEPEMFPGLVYRPKHPKVTIMVFVSGKVVLVGAKSYKDLVDAFESLYPSLVDFRKSDVVPNNRPLQISSGQPSNHHTTETPLEEKRP